MRPTLRQLQYLVALQETLQFRLAAEKCGVSQPALSSQIASMETEFGVTLVERGASGVRFTPAGDEAVRRARNILREMNNMRDAVRTSNSALGGRLNLGVLPSIGAYFLPTATRALQTEYPDLRLYVQEGDTHALQTHLMDGHFDCVLSTATDHPDTCSTPILTETLWICTAQDHPLMQGTSPVSIDALRGETLVCLDSSFHLTTISERLADIAGAYISEEYRGGSLDAVRQVAMMGNGIAVLPSLYALGEATRDSNVTVRKIDHPEAIHPIVFSWRRSSPLESGLQELAGKLATIEPIEP